MACPRPFPAPVTTATRSCTLPTLLPPAVTLDRLLRSQGCRAAIDHDVCAGDERRGVRGQEEGAPRDVLRLSNAADGDAVVFGCRVLGCFDDVGRQATSDQAGTDGVDADS